MSEGAAGAKAPHHAKHDEPEGEVENGPSELMLQRTLADLIFSAEAGPAFEQDPVTFGKTRGLGDRDTAALLRFMDRLGTYRDLARASLEEPLLNIFPITRALLGDEWEACVAAFLATRSIRSPHYRDIAPGFVAWLSETAWGQEQWPCLLALAHFEYVEVMVGRWSGKGSSEFLNPEPSEEGCIVLSPGAQVLAYAFAVHLADLDTPVPPEIPTHLLAYRDPVGEFRVLELTPATAALLVRGQEDPLAGAAASLAIEAGKEALSLLRELRASGAISGFR